MAFTWTDTTPTTIKAAHINELKTNYLAVQNARTYSPAYSYSFGFTTVNVGDTLQKTHIEQLRAAVNQLQAKMSNNCNCANCCQTCQACQSYSCQSTYCQSCQAQCGQCNDCDPYGGNCPQCGCQWNQCRG